MKISFVLLGIGLSISAFARQGDTAYYRGPEVGIAVEDAHFVVETSQSISEFLAAIPSNNMSEIDTSMSSKGPKYSMSHMNEPLLSYEWTSMDVVDVSDSSENFHTYYLTFRTPKERNRSADAVYYYRGELPELFKNWWNVNLGLPKRLVYPHREE